MDRMQSDVIATITPNPLRRAISVSVIAALGGALILLGLAADGLGLAGQLVLAGGGAAVLVLAERLRRATALTLELAGDRLVDGAGRVLCRIDDVSRVERGALAFKPANGFVLHLRAPMPPRVWAPGLWWRFGRRVGVGGAVTPAQARFMAEAIDARVSQRGAAS